MCACQKCPVFRGGIKRLILVNAEAKVEYELDNGEEELKDATISAKNNNI